MLGKLIKYDIKSLNRFLLIIHGFLLLFAILVRIFVTGRWTEVFFATGNSSIDELVAVLALITGIIFVTGISFSTAILIAVRFYKNLFSDEGYLTHTLPVTRGQHLLAKTISGSIWACADIFLIFLACYITLATPYIKEIFLTHKSEIMIEFGCTGPYADITLTRIIIVLALYSIFSGIANVVLYYASVTLGQFFTNHRVVGAVVAYFGISTVTTILASVSLAAMGLLRFGSDFENMSGIEYMISSLNVSFVLELIITIVLYMITYYIMKKKVNLA